LEAKSAKLHEIRKEVNAIKLSEKHLRKIEKAVALLNEVKDDLGIELKDRYSSDKLTLDSIREMIQSKLRENCESDLKAEHAKILNIPDDSEKQIYAKLVLASIDKNTADELMKAIADDLKIDTKLLS
jgi:hypothetical protein